MVDMDTDEWEGTADTLPTDWAWVSTAPTSPPARVSMVVERRAAVQRLVLTCVTHGHRLVLSLTDGWTVAMQSFRCPDGCTIERPTSVDWVKASTDNLFPQP